MTNCKNTEHISPCPTPCNLENDFAFVQTEDAKWVRAFEHVSAVRAHAEPWAASANPRCSFRNQAQQQPDKSVPCWGVRAETYGIPYVRLSRCFLRISLESRVQDFFF